MAVVLVHETPTLTREKYEQTVEKLAGKDRMESPSDWPVEGLLSHAAGEGPNGFRVVDVWESEEALNAFAEKLGPVLQEVGVEGEPQVYPAHTFVSA
jgi:thiamine pyrophosphate-dependent acetolactate synthase large subunit-like protein